jgi:tetratricopeptide (TPR) repeat protein
MKLIKEIFEELTTEQCEIMKRKDMQELERWIWKVCELHNTDPDNPSILFLLGTGFLNLGCFGTAISLLTRATQLYPESAETFNNLGACWKQLHQVDKAKIYLEKSLRLRVDPETLSNFATLYINGGQPEKGIAYAEASIRMAEELNKPSDQAKWNLALLQLETGDIINGFSNSDHGLLSGDRWLKPYISNGERIPYWNGTFDENKRILIYDEQGLGDRILFANCIRNFKGKMKVILDVHHRLEGLYRRSFPWVEDVWPNAKDEPRDDIGEHQVDYVVASGSLPKFFWKETSNIDRTPYLLPNPNHVKFYREKLFKDLGKPPYIGVGWKGGTPKTHLNDRSVKLTDIANLFSDFDGTLISLQYTNDAQDKLDRFNRGSTFKIHYLEEITEPKGDYDNTAAIVGALDCCFVPNTAVIHLCGSMGKNCVTFTPIKKAWRYCGNGDHLLWYGDHLIQVHELPGDTKDQWLNRAKRVFYERNNYA